MVQLCPVTVVVCLAMCYEIAIAAVALDSAARICSQTHMPAPAMNKAPWWLRAGTFEEVSITPETLNPSTHISHKTRIAEPQKAHAMAAIASRLDSIHFAASSRVSQGP